MGIVLALLVAAGAMGDGCVRGKGGGTRPLVFLTWEQEIELGRQAAPEFEKEFGGRYRDLAVQAYVRSVGERISRSTTHPDLPYQFAVLNSQIVNAFALPGGPVYVTRGLLEKLTTEGELAAVLSHEMAHVNARHAAQEMTRRMGVQILLDVIGAAAGRGGTGAGGAQYLRNLGKVVGTLVDLKYSRDQESEADRLGLDYMAAAGYDPEQRVRLFRMFETLERSKNIEWLSTHPNPEHRIETVQKIIREKYPNRGGRVAEEPYRREVLGRLPRS
jgi:predicted Zn-dependent protease